ncbi:unnamed protein product [Bursaphelenchus xylophilus]|uniref:(pine wood nematode) hypothetical protein n=1 Tax=Bursaphelenchus xylophilus TaxID=6326 RepID=A0A1I7SAW7_BURXY|nr:unnamed protein product [Bursaphelenchus xylophilus]CAG9106142.1 unnamed protein product [Bursaphelenchus xylophilus]
MRSQHLSGLFLTWAIYLYFRFVLETSNQFEHNQSRRTAVKKEKGHIFVALIEPQWASRKAVNTSLFTWLKGIDHEIFTHKNLDWTEHNKVEIPNNMRKGVSEARWLSSYLSVMHNTYNWYILTRTSSFILMENLASHLEKMPMDSAAFAVVENPINSTFHMMIANKIGLTMLAKSRIFQNCWDRQIRRCLDKVGKGVMYNIDRDESGNKSFFIETNTTSNFETFKHVSKKAHSFHNLQEHELRWFQVMIYGLQ